MCTSHRLGDPEGRQNLDELGDIEGAVPALVSKVEGRVVLLAADPTVLVEVHALEVACPCPQGGVPRKRGFPPSRPCPSETPPTFRRRQEPPGPPARTHL